MKWDLASPQTSFGVRLSRIHHDRHDSRHRMQCQGKSSTGTFHSIQILEVSVGTGSFHSIPSVAEGKFRDTNHVVV